MENWRNSMRFVFGLALAGTLIGTANAQSVWTYRNDIGRTSANINETILKPSNVNATQFGKLISIPVDGQIYAQPLYLPNVTIGGAQHNVIFIATQNDSVYAIDDTSYSILWHANLVDAAHGAAQGAAPVATSYIPCDDIQVQVGVTSTPVIDASAGTLYVEARSIENGNQVHRLHDLDITTGNEKITPVVVSATVRGTGEDSSSGTIPFAPSLQLNRAGLLLSQGNLYLGYGSLCDFHPFHGWVFAYDEATLAQKAVFITTPDGDAGGVWMGGAGLAADASGNLYINTGNGTYDGTASSIPDFGDSVLKLDPLTLVPSDYFTPYDQLSLGINDIDVGSAGILLLPDQAGPHPHELVAGSKEGRVYLIDRDQMTTGNQHYCNGCSSDPEIVQESPVGFGGSIFGGFAYWNGRVYLQSTGEPITSIPLSNGLLNFTNVLTTPTIFGWPGTQPTISANGTVNGIVWALDVSGTYTYSAVLHAYDALTMNELYNSAQLARDNAALAMKFSVPTVINGKVYVGTRSELEVYGLLGGATVGGGSNVVSISAIVVN